MKQDKTDRSLRSQTDLLSQANKLLEDLGYTEERLSMLEIQESDPLYTAMRQAKQNKKFNYA